MKKTKEQEQIINQDFYVIGIGTSAGGLQALKTFFDNLPRDFKHAIVIIQHLSPDYKSMMSNLLKKHTDLQIQEVQDNIEIQPKNIYLIPPSKNLTIESGRFVLTEKAPRDFNALLPIDIFFKSLAEAYTERAVGIILTGTGTDGSRGIRLIKENGGMLMAQSPHEAEFNGMPNSSIATGLIDYVLPIKEIPKELIAFLDSPQLKDSDYDLYSLSETPDFKRIINVIYRNTKIDYSSYKAPTLARRIIKRINITKNKNLSTYLRYLNENEEEVFTLQKEFLIGVTRFFRDPESFKYLESNIIPKLFEDKDIRDTIKVWVVGCSTGEEAYSIAILLEEYRELINSDVTIKIFATDLDKEAILKAGRGAYTLSIAADVNSKRLSKYFTRRDDFYVVSPRIRKSIIFSQHNVVQNPPLTKMDLVSCRNLLIYLQKETQQQVISSLHYSLKKDKFMFLGSSESVGDLSSSLEVVSSKHKVYKNTVTAGRLNYNYKGTSLKLANPNTDFVNRSLEKGREERLAQILADTVMQEFSAASAYVDKNFNLISADGDLRKYFEFPKNKLRILNILKILPKNVSMSLSSAVKKADKSEKKVVYKGIEYKRADNGEAQKINITVKPIKRLFSIEDHTFLVVFTNDNFEIVLDDNTLIKDAGVISKFDKDRVTLLEEELSDTKDSLESMIEKVETANEELQTTNEELLASNEELQSTNEELQSVNEELHTVNTEHQEKIEEIIKLNEDLENLIRSTEIGSIFLDKDFRIRKFTPAIKDLFNFLESDIGRPLAHFNTTLGESTSNLLDKSIRKVFNSGKKQEKDIKINGKWFIKRTVPYFDIEDEIIGCVITFIDITVLKSLQSELTHKNKFLEGVNDLVPSVIYIYNQKTNSNEYANKELLETLGHKPEDLQKMGSNILTTLFHPDDVPRIQEHFKKIREDEVGVIHEIEYRVINSQNEWRWFLSKDTIYERIPRSKYVKHIGVATDITENKLNQKDLRDTNIMYDAIVEGSMAGYWDWHIKENYEFMSLAFKNMFGYQDHEIPNTPDWWQKNIHPDDLPKVLDTFDKHVKSKGRIPYDNEVRYYHKDGSIVWVYCKGKVIEWDENGEPLRMVGSHTNITPFKNAQANLEKLNKELDRRIKKRTDALNRAEKKFHDLYDYGPDMFLSVEPKNGNVIECNETLLSKLGYKRQEIIGKPVFKLYHPNSRDKAKLAWDLFVEEGQVKNVELTVITKNRKKIDVMLNANSVLDGDGNVMYSNSTWRDVSELKEVITDLEELTYVTTHDLKAPINNIAMFLNLLKEDKNIKDKGSKEAIGWIEQNVTKAEDTLKNLLSVTKARALVLEDMATINLEDAIEEVKERLALDNKKNKCEITYDLSKCSEIKFSRVHLISMLQNIIGNAIKYKHPDRDPKIHIETSFNNNHNTITISDNGVGIDLKEHKDRVFGLFKRANDDTKGSGLALYIIKKVLEKTGGKIEVKSKVGEGSSFSLFFKK